MDNLNIIPEALTREEHYFKYLATGGDVNSLPKPVSRRDSLLYAMCLNGSAIGGGTGVISIPSKKKQYVKAISNSQSTNENMLAVMYDLGETRDKDAKIKIRYRFTVESGTVKPSEIGVKAHASNNDNINTYGDEDFKKDFPSLKTSFNYGEEIIFELEYPTVDSTDKKLADFRYLKPLLFFKKPSADDSKVVTFEINVHEVILYLNNEPIDLTTKVVDYAPVENGKSKVEVLEEDAFRLHVEGNLNSNATDQNYVACGYKTPHTKYPITVKYRFELKDTGDELPRSIQAKLLADTVDNYTDFSKAIYKTDVMLKDSGLEYNKEYTFYVNYPAEAGGVQLSTCNVLKPYLMLFKQETDTTKTITHGIDIKEISININGIVNDITSTATDLQPQGKSTFKIIRVEPEIEKAILEGRLPYWYDKIVNVIGDSIAFGHNGENGQQMDNPWVKQLEKLCGFKKANNYGINSSRISSRNTEFANISLVNRYTDMVYADLIIIACGVNDALDNTPLGDFENNDNTTFKGALGNMLKGMTSKYQSSQFLIITPLPWWGEKSAFRPTTGTNGSGRTVNVVDTEPYREALREAGRIFSIPVLEGSDLGLSNITDEATAIWYGVDKAHPNQFGANQKARRVANYINNIL